MIPKVEFKVRDIDEYVGMLQNFLVLDNHSWASKTNSIFKAYPELKDKLEGLVDVSTEQRNQIIYEFFTKEEKENKPKMNEKGIEFQKSWDEINDAAMSAISEVAEIAWPEKDKSITAHVSLSPICPRYIQERRYMVPWFCNTHNIKRISFHEIFHFIYFEKWKSVFPDAKKEEFEAPHLVWHLSEIVPGIALRDKRIQNVLEHEPNEYEEYTGCRIDNKPLLGYIREFYEQRKDFEDFLKKSWNFAKQHEQDINFFRNV